MDSFIIVLLKTIKERSVKNQQFCQASYYIIIKSTLVMRNRDILLARKSIKQGSHAVKTKTVSGTHRENILTIITYFSHENIIKYSRDDCSGKYLHEKSKP